MARQPLSNPWPQIVREPDHRDTREMMSGHPTSPGFRDEKPLRMGLDSPGNGQPGVPRTVPGRRGTPGFPGQVGAPVQPGTDYIGPHDF